MSAAQQSGEPKRDYGSPATWGDVESARLSLEKQMAELRTELATMEGRLNTQIAEVRTEVVAIQAQMAQLEPRMEGQVAGVESRMEARIAGLEARLIRWFAGATAASIGLIGVLVGILQAVD